MTVRVAGRPPPFHQAGSLSHVGRVADARMVVSGAFAMIRATTARMTGSRWTPMLGSSRYRTILDGWKKLDRGSSRAASSSAAVA